MILGVILKIDNDDSVVLENYVRTKIRKHLVDR